MADSKHLLEVGEFDLDNFRADLLNSLNSHNPSSSMVVIKDTRQEEEDFLLVFPPSQHENIYSRPSITTADDDEELLLSKPHCSTSSPSSSLSSCSSLTNVSTSSIIQNENHDSSSTAAIVSLSPTSFHHEPAAASRAKDLTVWHGCMNWIYIRLKASIEKLKGMILNSPLLTTVLLLGYVYFQRKRLNIHQRRWKKLIRESRRKDQRISELLNQITRMNEMMLILQRNSVKSIKN